MLNREIGYKKQGREEDNHNCRGNSLSTTLLDTAINFRLVVLTDIMECETYLH